MIRQNLILKKLNDIFVSLFPFLVLLIEFNNQTLDDASLTNDKLILNL